MEKSDQLLHDTVTEVLKSTESLHGYLLINYREHIEGTLQLAIRMEGKTEVKRQLNDGRSKLTKSIYKVIKHVRESRSAL